MRKLICDSRCSDSPRSGQCEVYKMRRDLEWIGKKVPIADARWIGSLLKQLSHRQLVDAFRAGQFSPEGIEKYVAVVENRINELAQL